MGFGNASDSTNQTDARRPAVSRLANPSRIAQSLVVLNLRQLSDSIQESTAEAQD